MNERPPFIRIARTAFSTIEASSKVPRPRSPPSERKGYVGTRPWSTRDGVFTSPRTFLALASCLGHSDTGGGRRVWDGIPLESGHRLLSGSRPRCDSCRLRCCQPNRNPARHTASQAWCRCRSAREQIDRRARRNVRRLRGPASERPEGPLARHRPEHK